MKIFYIGILLAALPLMLSSCAAGPYQEDEKVSEPQGPGLFTGDKGAFSVSDAFDENKKKLKSGGYYILDLDGSPRMSEEEFKEFENFRAWLNSREQGTEEYKEYEAWRAFQQYRNHQSTKSTDAQ